MIFTLPRTEPGVVFNRMGSPEVVEATGLRAAMVRAKEETERV